jgi:hypothetical protein
MQTHVITQQDVLINANLSVQARPTKIVDKQSASNGDNSDQW